MKITLLSGKTFDINADLGFDMKVVHSGRSRRLTLRIDKKDRMAVLTIPKYCSRKKAVSFVESHQDWVRDNLSKIPELKFFKNHDVISLFGREYTIEHSPVRGSTRLDKKTKFFMFPAGLNFCTAALRTLLKSWRWKSLPPVLPPLRIKSAKPCITSA